MDHILACAHLGNQYVCLNSAAVPYCVGEVCDSAERERLYQEAFRTGLLPLGLFGVEWMANYPTLEEARAGFDAAVAGMMAGAMPARFDGLVGRGARRHGGDSIACTEGQG